MSIRFKLLALYLLTYGCLSHCHAQLQSYRFNSYTKEDGISSGYVNDIVQDTLGYMWLATAFGLNKFDGHRFTTYMHQEKDAASIGSSYIRSLYVDTKGNLWAGHTKGLSKYNPLTDDFLHYFEGIYVRHIQEDQSANLWLATNKGLICFNGTESKFYQNSTDDPKSLPTNNILTTLTDSQGMIWIGTNGNGLCRLNPLNDSIVVYTHVTSDLNSLSHNNVLSLFEDDRQQIWVGTVNGLNKFNPHTAQFKRFYSDEYPITTKVIFDISQDSSGTIWFGSYSGLNKLNEAKKEYLNMQHVDVDPNSLSDNQIRSLFIKDNFLWIGTYNGLNTFDFSTTLFRHIKHIPTNEKSLSSSFVWKIVKDEQGKLWVGTKEGGLNVLDDKLERIHSYGHHSGSFTSISNNDVYDIFEDGSNKLWATTDGGGLNLLHQDKQTFSNVAHNPTKNAIFQYSKHIKSFFKDNQGFYWIGTVRDGLGRYDPRTNQLKSFTPIAGDTTSLSSERIYHILQDKKERLWIATNEGLCLFNYEKENFKRYMHVAGKSNSLSSNTIYSIQEDAQAGFWLGTRDGLNFFDPDTDQFKAYTTADGLPDNTVYVALADAHQNLWLSTNKGICKFNPKTGTSISYDKEDGLQSDEFNTGAYFKDQSGFLYFGGVNGLTIFHPDSIEAHTKKPKVAITDFLLFNKPVAVSDSTVLSKPLDCTERITLNYDDYIFAFEFAALNFRQASKNQYAYRLFPFDQNWITASAKDRKAVFTNVPHGTYEFQVKASNDDGYWNEQGATIQVIILPPWWLTWWMKAMYWILGIGLPLTFYFLRVAALKKQQKILEVQVERRTAEISRQNQRLLTQKERIEAQTDQLKTQNSKLLELDDFKQNMTGMIIHDLKNPLNSIINASEANPQQGIQQLKKSGRQMLTMVLNILDVYKYEDSTMQVTTAHETVDLLLAEAVEEVRFLAEAKHIQLVQQASHRISVQAEREVIIRVLVNLLTNAIKYSPQNGVITIDTSMQNDKAYIAISDTGQGIPKEKIGLIFQKFQQLQAKHSGDVRSTGLGLAFCKLAIEAHQGEIGVKSEVGKGSTFWFSLPLGKVSENDELHPQGLIALTKDQKRPMLTPSSQSSIAHHIEKLNMLMVYEASDIELILEEITSDATDISNWKEALRVAVYNMNEQQYKMLLNAAE